MRKSLRCFWPFFFPLIKNQSPFCGIGKQAVFLGPHRSPNGEGEKKVNCFEYALNRAL